MIKYENISIINLISLCYFFLPLIIYHKSYISYIVFINGLIFHSNKNNIYLFCYDTIFNIFLVIYKNYYNPNINKLTLIGSTIFVFNVFYIENINIIEVYLILFIVFLHIILLLFV